MHYPPCRNAKLNFHKMTVLQFIKHSLAINPEGVGIEPTKDINAFQAALKAVRATRPHPLPSPRYNDPSCPANHRRIHLLQEGHRRSKRADAWVRPYKKHGRRIPPEVTSPHSGIKEGGHRARPYVGRQIVRRWKLHCHIAELKRADAWVRPY